MLYRLCRIQHQQSCLQSRTTWCSYIDYFKRATSDLADLDIADTEVAWLSSDGDGTCGLSTHTRANVDSLRNFVAAGGILIADLASQCASYAVAPMADESFFDLGTNGGGGGVGPSTTPEEPADNILATTPNNLTGLTANPLSYGILHVRLVYAYRAGLVYA
jgi:hypothetical protein